MTDRLIGTFLMVIAAGYAWVTRGYEAGFFSDPVGPRVFPYLIGGLLGLSGLWLVIKPDPNPSWPPASQWLSFGLVLISLVGYAYLLVPLGFILATFLEMSLLSMLFGARWWQALGSALLFSLAVYFLFTEALGVTLPTGRLFNP